jgi:hypothetical protein
MTLYVSRHGGYRREIWPGNETMMNVNGTPKMVVDVPNYTVEFKTKMLTEAQRKHAATMFNMVPYGRDLVLLPQSVDLGDDEHGKMIGHQGWKPGYSPDAAAGAMPRQHDDIILGPAGPEAAEGYDPQFHLSSFNTGDCEDAKGKYQRDPECMIPFQSVGARTDAEKLAVWKITEEVLHSCSDFGVAFVALDASTLPVPFPGYAKIRGDDDTAIEQMATLLSLAQFNAGVLLEYEQQTQKRPNMMALFEKTYNEQKAAAQRQAEVLAGLEVTL